MATDAAPADLDGLHTALSKIRHHTSSKLDNQRAPAQLLVAIESTLNEQDAGSSSTPAASAAQPSQHAVKQRQPAEYFLALDSMLQSTQTKQPSPTLLPCVVYLLSIVAPHVSAGVIRARLASLVPPIGTILSQPHPDTQDASAAENYPATLRAALGVFQAILTAFGSDLQSLQKDAPLRACWNAALNLCADTRPKVRRRAQELVCAILPVSSAAFTSAKPKHPLVAPTFDWCVRTLATVADAEAVVASGKKSQQHAPQYDKKSGKAKQASAAAALRQQRVSEGDNASVGIWVCGFVKQIVGLLPLASVDPLSSVLLRLPGLQNPFLSVAALDVFEAIFKNCRSPDAVSQTAALLAPTQSSAQPSSIGQKTLAHLIESLRSPNVAPSANDVQLIPSYLRALEHALVAYSQFEEGRAAWSLVPDVWTEVFAVSLSTKSDASRTSPHVRAAGRDALCAMVRYCVSDDAIAEAIRSHGSAEPKSAFLQMIQSLEDALGRQSLQYVHSRPEILAILTAIIGRLRHKYIDGADSSKGRKAAAGLLTFHLVRQVADMRSQPSFDHREHADAVISTAVEVCGPRMVLEALPLNLFGEHGGNGRAWLLPLMRTKITNAELSHFTEYFVPLSETLFNKRAEAQQGGADGVARPVEAKMWEALTEQVWACFPAYCDMPVDLPEAFTRQFAELLTNVLYTQPGLRPSVCRGLQALVERSEALVNSGAAAEMLKEAFALDQTDGKANITHLSALAPNLLAVLFNVFSQSPSSSRGYIYECICTYLSIMKGSDIADTYIKVKGTLDKSLASLPKGRAPKEGAGAIPPVPHTMLDLLVALVPFLAKTNAEQASDLFDFACEDRLLRSHDAGVQKKTYKILSRLVEGSTGKQVLRLTGKKAQGNRVGELLAKLRDSTPDAASGAKRDRILLLATLVPNIPADELHFLPSIIPEAVLATKEANQATRENAYELLVQMGNKMASGGSINRGLVDGLSKDSENDKGEDEAQDDTEMQDTATVQANVGEYLTMVAAGMAGATPHMISATITAISRLVYEFKEDLPADMLNELLTTIEVFLQSANREIVKGALGFVKVAIVDYPSSLLDKHLAVLIPALLGWSSEHTMHFKPKIRHMFERLIRRFGYEKIHDLCPEENRKVIVNIKKRKERAKRQKSQADGEDEDLLDAQAGPRALKRSTGNDAFEEVIYGSESELSGSDSDEEGATSGPAARAANGRKGGKGADATGGQRKTRNRRQHEDQAYIMEDDDEPMDLLDRSAAVRITARNPNAKADRRRKPGQDAAKFALDEATGRLLINESDDDSGPSAADMLAAADGGEVDVVGAGRAYLDKDRGRDGFKMTRGGAVKFNKNNKRSREQDRELEEEQIATEEAAEAAANGGAVNDKTKKRKKEKERIGAEFRAKKADGDVIKNGKSPYAYVPLSQVAGKKAKGKGQDISFTGKRSKRK
ncbi:pre-rRNA processing protein [Thecaphora frezii]